MNEVLLKVSENKFLLGLMIGLLIAVVVKIEGWFEYRVKLKPVKSENSNLKKELCAVTLRDNEAYRIQTESYNTLKEENQILKVKAEILKRKPSRVELEKLLVYEKAIDFIAEQYPDFEIVWKDALEDAHKRVEFENMPFSFKEKIISFFRPNGNILSR